MVRFAGRTCSSMRRWMSRKARPGSSGQSSQVTRPGDGRVCSGRSDRGGACGEVLFSEFFLTDGTATEKGVSNPFTIGGNPWTCGRQQCLETCEKRGSTSTTYSQQWHDRGSLCAFANLKRVTPAQVTTSCLQTNVRPKREFYRLNVGWAAEDGRINTRSHEPVAARCRTATELTESQQGVQWPTTSCSD